MIKRPFSVALALTLLPFSYICAQPQQELSVALDSQTIKLQRLVHRDIDMEIDGRLSEGAWSTATAINQMRIIEPETLDAPAYSSNVRILYTERGIYIGFDLEQPNETIIQRISTRDNIDLDRDTVSITLDASGEGLFGYWMTLALGDNQADGTVLPERQYASQWDGAWYGATSVTDTGWSAEFYVPWGQMAMPRADGERRIGIYTERKVAHLDETWAWPPIPESNAIFMSALPGIGLDGVDVRQQWSLFPYISTTFDEIDKDIDYKGGFDVFWRPSSNFQLTATANPDFGSAESDNVVVNLTANETFFPEKRLFFQEGQEVFNTTPRSTGSNGKRLSIVNTRRIGARARVPDLPTGTSISTRERIEHTELLGALKATGQIGSVRYGLMSAFEDEREFKTNNGRLVQDGRDFTALRMIYEDSKGAAYRGLGYIGSLVQHPESDAQVHAVDGHFLSSSGRWNIDAQIIRSDTDEKGQGGGAFADIVYTPSQGLKHTLQMSYLDDKLYVNDFGFQERNDSRELWYRFEWIKTDMDWARTLRFSPFLRYEENGEGDRTNNAFPVLNTNITLNNLDRVSVGLFHFPKRYDDLNSFGNGTFATAERTNINLSYQTNTAKPVSYKFGFGRSGEFVGGNSSQWNTGVVWRPRDNISFEADVSYNNRNGWLLHQQNQDFTTFNADQWRMDFSFEYFLTARQQLSMALQWVGIEASEDEFYNLPSHLPTKNRDLVQVAKPAGPSDDFGLSQLNFQLRYRWQIAPLSDLFIVYTKGDSRRTAFLEFDELFENSWDEPLGSELVVKLRYRLGT
ncbi:MAG: DUF5916 domain-containing protein [Pseudohongiellaceae bacterium]|nr:DUF5916 domain-containing protein [Pseudohongiellaceae bacterium]